jgi:hypothetical protein
MILKTCWSEIRIVKIHFNVIHVCTKDFLATTHKCTQQGAHKTNMLPRENRSAVKSTSKQQSQKSSLFKNLNWSVICYICKERKYVVVDLQKFESANHKKDWVLKSQKCHICGRFAKFQQINNFKSSNVRICETP